MTASKEFQEHLQAEQISQAIALVVGKLVELDVTTDLAATNTSPQTSLSTKISLLTGKITTEVNPELLSRESAQQILDFHTAQITATNKVVRDHLHSLRELLQILRGVIPPSIITSDNPPVPVFDQIADQQNITDSDLSTVSEILLPPLPPPVEQPATPPADLTPSVLAKISNIADDEFQHIEKLLQYSDSKKTENGSRAAAGMAAAVAQAGSPKLDEANSIPNKFDQVLKSAGVKEKEDAANNPFTSAPQVAKEPDNIRQPATSNYHLDEEWDEWLLEEDAILSELSQVSEEVTRDKIPDWNEHWLNRSIEPKVATEDWESFIPEYVDLDAHQGQANVERFRQNLVNDPQLMSELLAELDDIEKLNKDERPKS